MDGADPGDVGRGGGEEVAGFVVGLEDAEGVEDAPAVEPEEEGAEDMEPGAEATVGGAYIAVRWRDCWGCLDIFLALRRGDMGLVVGLGIGENFVVVLGELCRAGCGRVWERHSGVGRRISRVGFAV